MMITSKTGEFAARQIDSGSQVLKEAFPMKQMVSFLGVLALVSGCAAGTEDPAGDTNLSTDQTGTVAADPNSASLGGEPQGNVNPSNEANMIREKHNQFDTAPQIIPMKPNRGPSAPDPGPVHGPAGGPR
jgi:hypothetical protein